MPGISHQSAEFTQPTSPESGRGTERLLPSRQSVFSPSGNVGRVREKPDGCKVKKRTPWWDEAKLDEEETIQCTSTTETSQETPRGQRTRPPWKRALLGRLKRAHIGTEDKSY